MRKLGTIIVAGLLVTSAAACKKKKEADEGGKVTEGSDKGTDKGTDKGADPGSAKGTDKGTDTTAPTAKTGEEVAAAYQGCWDHFNNRKWDEFKGCFADDSVTKDLASGTEDKGPDAAVAHAKGFADAFSDGKGAAQLILVNGNHVLGVWLFTGTNDGALKMPQGDVPATNKKLGILVAHGVELNAEGKVTEEWLMMDQTSFAGQLGLLPDAKIPFRAAIEAGAEKPEIVIAKNDDVEKNNLAAEDAELEAFNAHNLDGFSASVTENVVWSEGPAPKDATKAEFVQGMKDFFGGFSDLKLDKVGTWAAGDYTVGAYQMSGTNDKPMPAMMLDGKGAKFAAPNIKITHRKDGKNDKTWIFYNGMSMMQQLMGAGGDKPADDGEKPADGDKPADGEKTE